MHARNSRWGMVVVAGAAAGAAAYAGGVTSIGQIGGTVGDEGGGPVRWVSPHTGFYFDADNWSGGAVPGPADSLLFDLDRAYAVLFEHDAAALDAEVVAGNVGWWSLGRSLTLSGKGDEAALRIGAPGRLFDSLLEIVGHSVAARGVAVAPEASLHGSLRVEFFGTLSVDGLPLVAGPGAARVEVDEFGSLHASAGIVALGSASLRFDGDLMIGTLPGALFLEGESSAASLALGADASAASAGRVTFTTDARLDVELSDRAEPWVFARDGASVGGVLNLTVEPGFTPQVGDRFDLVLGDGPVDGVFDLIYTQGLSGSDFLRVVYPAGRGGNVVQAVVDSAAGEIDFNQDDTTSIPPGAPKDTAVADVNMDGLLDVAVALDNGSMTPGVVVVLLNAGVSMGEWLGLGDTVQITVGVEPVALAAGDLNGDGYPEIVSANRADDTISVLWNDTGSRGVLPSFSVLTIPVGDEPVDVAIGDFDNSGVPDIAVLCAGDQTLQIFSDIPLRGFGGGSSFGTGGRSTSLSPADIDNDKDLDVIGGNGAEDRGVVTGGTLFVLTNEGGAEFGPPTLTETGVEPIDTIALDIQGDGLIDAITLDAGGTLSLHTNQPGRALTLRTQVELNGTPSSISMLDAELDGDADLALVTEELPGATIRILRNDATSAQPTTFSEQPAVLLSESPILINTGDMNNDGLPDLVAVAEDDARGVSANVVAVLLNVGRPALLGELNGDCIVDTADLGRLIAWFGSDDPAADLNDDGVVDTMDLGMLIGQYGTTCDDVLGGSPE